MKHIAILLAGGSSKRMKQTGKDKLLHPIRKTNAFRLCYQAFAESLEIENIIIVYRDEEQKALLEKSNKSNYIMVSHNINNLIKHCDNLLVIEKGKLKLFEDIQRGIDYFKNSSL